MSEQGSTRSIDISALAALLDGSTLREITEIKESVASQLASVEETARKLRSGDREVVVEAIRDLLAGDLTGLTRSELKAIEVTTRPQHRNSPLLEACLRANVPAYMYGEAGSSKSFAAEDMAVKYQLDFRAIPLSPSLMDSRLLGYNDANGNHVRTGFREIYERGGVFLFDEMDNANPSSLAVINDAIANRAAEFADGRVTKHPDTRILAGGNTIGKGANSLYVGRNQLDAATLDRFAFVSWDIDDALERAIILGGDGATPIDITDGGVPTKEEWVNRVQGFRDNLRKNGLRHVISMRAAVYGGRLIEEGVGVDHLDDMLIFKGMDESGREPLSKGLDR